MAPREVGVDSNFWPPNSQLSCEGKLLGYSDWKNLFLKEKGVRMVREEESISLKLLVCWSVRVSSTPVPTTILEKRKLENRTNAFLETTELVSGKAGSKPGGKFLQGSPACSPGETGSLTCGQHGPKERLVCLFICVGAHNSILKLL